MYYGRTVLLLGRELPAYGYALAEREEHKAVQFSE